MYHYQRAIGKAMDIAGRWQDIDITAMVLRSVYAQYRRAYVILTNDHFNYEVTLDLDSIKNQVIGTDLTIDDFLLQNGNSTLPVVNKVPSVKLDEVYYGSAVQAGYKAYLTDGSTSIDNENMSAKKHLYLQNEDRKAKDPDFFSKLYYGSLVSVNGYIHSTDYDVNGLYVKDAVKSRDVAGTNHLGIISFYDLGKLSFIPITKPMLHKREPDQVYRYAVDIDIGTNHIDKTIILVIGGYMHILDKELFYRTGDSSIRINFHKFNWLERYFESVRFLDMSNLGLTVGPFGSNAVNYDELFSDEVIANYLTMNESFVALLDNPDTYVEYEGLWTTRASATYNTKTFPKYPITVGHGRGADYWYEKDYEGWSVWHSHGHVDNLLDRTRVIEYGNNEIVTNQRQVSWPNVSSPDYKTQAHFKKIKSDSLKWTDSI